MIKKWFQETFGRKETKCCCQSLPKNLSEASVNKQMQVKCLHGEEGTCQRMREMGFCESSIVEKVSDNGALICKVCDTKVVISKELAQNIIVSDVCQLKGHQCSDGKMDLLSNLTLGQRGQVVDLIDSNEDCERLEEMGITPGEQVEIIRYAPMGDPIEIKIRGYNLSLRKDEAKKIKIKILS